jgi:MFS family permease
MSAAVLQPVRERDTEVIALVGLAHGTSHFFHMLLPPLYPWLMREFSLSFTQAGALMAVFFVVSGIGQALAGFVVDRHGARPVLFFGMATLAASGLVLALANDYPMLVLAAAVAGLGNSIFHPADFTLLNRRVRVTRLGHAFSVHGLAGNLGWATAPLVLVAVAQAASWRTAGLIAAGVGAAVLLLLVARREVLADAARSAPADAANVSASAAAPSNSRFEFLGAPSVWLCLMFFFFSTAAFAILQNFGPSILGNLYALDIGTAALTVSIYMLGAAGGTIAGGFLATPDRRTERTIAAALTVSALAALALASAAVPVWSVFVLIVMMGFGVGVAGPSRDLLVRQAATGRFGKASFGRVYGFVYSGLDLGMAVSPIVIGPLLDARQFQWALLVLAGLNLASIMAARAVSRSNVTQ